MQISGPPQERKGRFRRVNVTSTSGINPPFPIKACARGRCGHAPVAQESFTKTATFEKLPILRHRSGVDISDDTEMVLVGRAPHFRPV